MNKDVADYFEAKIARIISQKRLPYLRMVGATAGYFSYDVEFLNKWHHVMLEDVIVFDYFKMVIFSLEDYKV